jgi:hypothetical protein
MLDVTVIKFWELLYKHSCFNNKCIRINASMILYVSCINVPVNAST